LRELEKSLEESKVWKWQDKELKFAGIGIHSNIIEDFTTLDINYKKF
jgi:hypothetical protein